MSTMPNFRLNWLMDLSSRSHEPELLDGHDIPFEDIRQNMIELDTINSWLGGHRLTLAGFKHLAGDYPDLSVCEIGCGGGDNWRPIKNWCARRKIQARYHGIDINPDCVRVAREQFKETNCRFQVSDYRNVEFGDQKPDIMFSSLFCHHFLEQDLIAMLKWMRVNSSVGFFINDLHRHWFAYYSIKSLTTLFSKSYLVKNDAPLSVRRGFSKREWTGLLEKAGITEYSIRWGWAFRWLIIVYPAQSISS